MRYLIAVWENPKQIIIYKRPKDPSGQILDDIWTSSEYISQKELDNMIANKTIVRMNAGDDRGIWGYDCIANYRFTEVGENRL